VAQNEETCVVYGMPREAVKLGAAVDVLPLERVADALLHSVKVPAHA
jgi:two-component system chemotaxis response regulator CheB